MTDSLLPQPCPAGTDLSALENAQRNPNSKPTAVKAIGRHAETLGCTVEDILEAAGGLLDGRMSADDFRAALRDDVDADATAAEAPTGAPEAGPANEHLPPTNRPHPLRPRAARVAQPAPSQRARISVKAQLLAACQAAERVLHEDQIEADTLQMHRRARGRAGVNTPPTNPTAPTAPAGGTGGATGTQPEGQDQREGATARRLPGRRAGSARRPDRSGHAARCCAPPPPALRGNRAGGPRGAGETPRADSKQARLIAMLQRGASISDMTREASAGCGIPATARWLD